MEVENYLYRLYFLTIMFYFNLIVINITYYFLHANFKY